MTISDELFQLIKSLKQSEKRYFKIYASRHVKGKQNNYVKLFEYIDKQEVYDEAVIVKKFKGEAFTKQFSVAKNYLYNFILKSLRAYHAGNSVESKIHEGIESVKILYERGLIKKSIKILKSIKQQARNYEKYEQLLTILELEREIISRHFPDDHSNEYWRIWQKEGEECLKIIENKYYLRVLEDRANYLQTQYAVVRSQEDLEPYHEILAHPLLTDPDNAFSFEAKKSYNNIYGIYHGVQKNYEQICAYNEAQLDLMDNNPKFKAAYLHLYLEMNYKLLHAYLELAKYRSFHRIMNRMWFLLAEDKQKKIKLTEMQKIAINAMAINYELQYFNKKKDYATGVEFVEAEVVEWLERCNRLIKHEFKTEIVFATCKLYFFADNYSQALDWVNKIVFDENPNPADDILCFARLLNLLIHYELDNLFLLSSEITSTRRFLKKKKRLYKFEKLVLKYIKRLVDNRYSVSGKVKQLQQELLLSFQEELQTILQEPFEQRSQTYLHVDYWLAKKLK